MAINNRIQINTEEYGLISIEDLYKYQLFSNCKALSYDPENKKVDFYKIISLRTELRSSYYVITTLKKNRIILAPDQLIFNDYTWKLPPEFNLGDEIWINNNKSIVSDVITSIQLEQKNLKLYALYIEDDLPFFANKILLKEPENV